MEMERICAEYLRSINPIAQRIAEDLENVQNSNQEKWSNLDVLARLEIIDKNLIDKELVEKYQDQTLDDSELDPISTFSWFTRSQLDLYKLIEVKIPQNKSPIKKTDVLSPLKKGHDTVDGKHGGIINQIKLKVMKTPQLDENSRCEARLSKTLPKPRMPPPPPPPKRLSNSENSALILAGSSSQDDIPKTGFDFLDNW